MFFFLFKWEAKEILLKSILLFIVTDTQLHKQHNHF